MTQDLSNALLNDLIGQMHALTEKALTEFQNATDKQSLYDKKVLFSGKNGSVTALMKKMGQLTPEQKPQFGAKLNEAKQKIEQLYQERETSLGQAELSQKLASETLDLTLPGFAPDRGGDHPVHLVTNEIVDIMARLGYSARLGPMVERDYYNFEALNIPKDHPARDMQDTFFVDDNLVLRTHTSPIQIHSLEKDQLPLRIVGTGSVFRVDSDISHLPHFHQIEGMCVDRNVSMADLKGTIAFFVREFFGPGLKTRFRPSYFPFTEPSAEVDVLGERGWLEVGGCGVVHPNVLRNVGIDPAGDRLLTPAPNQNDRSPRLPVAGFFVLSKSVHHPGGGS